MFLSILSYSPLCISHNYAKLALWHPIVSQEYVDHVCFGGNAELNFSASHRFHEMSCWWISISSAWRMHLLTGILSWPNIYGQNATVQWHTHKIVRVAQPLAQWCTSWPRKPRACVRNLNINPKAIRWFFPKWDSCHTNMFTNPNFGYP